MFPGLHPDLALGLDQGQGRASHWQPRQAASQGWSCACPPLPPLGSGRLKPLFGVPPWLPGSSPPSWQCPAALQAPRPWRTEPELLPPRGTGVPTAWGISRQGEALRD